MFVFHETSPDFLFSLISHELHAHVGLNWLTEVLKLYGVANSYVYMYVQRIIASAKQVASQERCDFAVSN